ncbi:hypothetical protein LIER_08807 [Lithospermum erythrorhizon]|uniref:YABBY N-terminal domain-containing protein n=1 Tax=Lithospermum erythrorhizon TaxID=34254 RepID=A0AAV3PG82_LITER
MSSENVCHVHCNFCNTNLVVSVPCSTMMNIITVKCGRCANLLSVNVGGGLPQCLPIHQELQMQKQSSTHEVANGSSSSSSSYSSSSSNMSKFDPLQQSADRPQLKMSPIRR